MNVEEDMAKALIIGVMEALLEENGMKIKLCLENMYGLMEHIIKELLKIMERKSQ